MPKGAADAPAVCRLGAGLATAARRGRAPGQELPSLRVAPTQPVKNLSGGGFTFEDRVGAWLGAAVLAGTAPLDPALGPPVRIDFQRDADGWRLDDLLIGFGGARCCASVKSYMQIDYGRGAKDFVGRAWEELLGISGSSFDPGTDLVAMVTAPIHADSRSDVHELIRLARAQDPDELAERIATEGFASERRRTLWDSFAIPEPLAGVERGTLSGSPGELLLRLRVLEADFEHSPSSAHEQALGWCRQALVDPSEALALWESLLAIVSELRTAGGTLTGELLVSRLRERFELRDHPAYERDWAALRALSDRNIEQIPDRLGDGLHVERVALVSQLDEAVGGGRLVALVGSSGCGKTAAAKAWALSRDAGAVIWLHAEQLAGIAQPGGGLRHPLLETVSAGRSHTWLIVDGLDRAFSDSADGAVAELVSAVKRTPSLPIGVIVTSQQQEWARVGERLAAHNAIADWQIVAAESFSSEEIGVVLEAYPALRDVAYRGRLTGVLRGPKVLDTILRALLAGGLDQAEPLTGQESGFAKWFYEKLACGTGRGRASRAALVMHLAELQGDRLQPQTPLTELDAAALDHLDDLERDGVCEQRDGRVRFTHELYGDWIRHQLLVAHDPDRTAYIRARLTSPLWHRAIRLRALSLLNADDDAAAWLSEMHRLGGDELGLLHDLFLEALLFSAEPRPTVERVWPILIENDGRLLRRLLARFRHVATVAHPGAVEAVSALAEELSTHVAATQRLPYWPLWLPLLGTLSDHAEEALTLAGDAVAQITDLWLRFTPEDWPLRDQAAALAIANGRRLLAHKRDGGHASEEHEARSWRAVLASVRERYEDVVEISMALAPPPDDPHTQAASASRRRSRNRLDRVFAETCLDGDALHPVIVADPGLASLILLAVLTPRPPDAGFGMPGDELGILAPAGWFIPLYTRGPFLPFLRAAPAEARAFMLRLVESATDRWAETRDGEDAVSELELPLQTETVRLRGDQQVMQWYRGEHQVPSPLACALMALEKWLYDEADAGRDIAPIVTELLQGTRSLAIIGLVIGIGCRQPQLLAGPLQPLLAAPELFLWDTGNKLHEPRHLLIGLFREPAEFRRLAEEWYLLEHRRVTLEQCAQQLMLTDSAVESFLEQQLPAWRDQLGSDGEPAALRFLIARLDRANWKQRTDQQGQRYWELEPPEELRAESDATATELNRQTFGLTFPGQCRRILDGELELPEDQLEEFWTQVSSRIAEPPSSEVTTDGVISADDAGCGLAVVLIVGHREWLRQHPEREQRCLDTLLQAVAVERERKWFDDARGGTDWSWDAFCADALPAIWAEQPEEPLLRRAIARLAFSLSYATIRRLFAACAAVRDRLGTDFGRLQHFAVHVARFRRAAEVARHRANARIPDRAAMEERIGQFLDGTLEATVPAWAQFAVPPAPSRQSWGELDTGYLQAAYAWVPPIDQARDAAERADWVAHWRECVTELVERLRRNVDPADGEVDGTPYEDEYELLRGLPGRIIGMRSDEARPLWKPILALGEIAHYWVESFVNMWCIVGLQSAPASESFLSLWEEMLDYVESEPTWSGAQRSFRTAELQYLLLGLGATTLDLWSAEPAPVVARLAPRFERWARENLARRDDAARFASFLRRDGAAPLLSDGLSWLAAASTPATDRQRDNHYEEALGSLLDDVRRRTPEITPGAGADGEAYRSLLTRLADRQVPIALELISRMSSSTVPSA